MLNYDGINKEAAMMGISPFLLIKRKLHYRVINSKQKCADCKSASLTKMFNGYRCSIIGESKDLNSEISPKGTCKYFLRREAIDEKV